MGHARPRPRHLAAKLLRIRQALSLSQKQLAKRLNVQDYTDISKYERDVNEPTLAVLLAYSRASGIPLEQIIDDHLELKPTPQSQRQAE
jgi:transcriptional regulator with XRE-family HTH domain